MACPKNVGEIGKCWVSLWSYSNKKYHQLRVKYHDLSHFPDEATFCRHQLNINEHPSASSVLSMWIGIEGSAELPPGESQKETIIIIGQSSFVIVMWAWFKKCWTLVDPRRDPKSRCKRKLNRTNKPFASVCVFGGTFVEHDWAKSILSKNSSPACALLRVEEFCLIDIAKQLPFQGN